MTVTLSIDDFSTVQDHGSIVLITGTGEEGQRVTFGVEPRMLDDIAGLAMGDGDVDVWVEGWQIMGTF